MSSSERRGHEGDNDIEYGRDSRIKNLA